MQASERTLKFYTASWSNIKMSRKVEVNIVTHRFVNQNAHL